MLRVEVGARALRVRSMPREEAWASAGVQGAWVSGCGCEADYGVLWIQKPPLLWCSPAGAVHGTAWLRYMLETVHGVFGGYLVCGGISFYPNAHCKTMLSSGQWNYSKANRQRATRNIFSELLRVTLMLTSHRSIGLCAIWGCIN
jgi:hypothetical protein